MLGLGLLIAIAAVETPDVPTLDGEKPTFGFLCTKKASKPEQGNVRYFVFLPENRPIGAPQSAKVKFVDGVPSLLPQHEMVLAGELTGIVAPPPPVSPTATTEPMQRLAGLTANTDPSQPVQTRLEVFIGAIVEVEADGQRVARTITSSGTLSVASSADRKGQLLDLACSDLRGEASGR